MIADWLMNRLGHVIATFIAPLRGFYVFPYALKLREIVVNLSYISLRLQTTAHITCSCIRIVR